MDNYLEKLANETRLQGYDDTYTYLCVQYASRLINNGLPVIFDPDHLAMMIGLEPIYIKRLFYFSNKSEKLYKEIEIPKKTGGFRTLSVPIEGLKYIQRWILENILNNIPVSSSAMGFVKGKSIVDNAIKHVNKECVINYDIKNFFPTIKRKDIFRIFKYYGYTNEVSYLLSKICTYNDSLPQGAPTSPYLSNIHCLRLDKRFLKFSNKIDGEYSRYADDITISGSKKITSYSKVIEKIIEDEGFIVNEKKTRYQKQIGRQIVTGLIVNKHVSVPIQRKRYLRQQIYYCKRYGVSSHLKYINSKKSNFKQYLYGLAYFVKMVEKERGEYFIDQLNHVVWDY
ncbi:retron St85 family RNA-directed DNA polymerase [Paenibacillus sp. WQ 127069]|uniref:RNA-directed DNA polymerase n=1 Tax=Paenibacillus baimaensis TaxID=2982185 RepID=A0ABT2UGG4_9BACL|nr:retron St85 family RNA-directed DNA polymerase [Paenibacillus sp. WQ 127069]MCU6793729.1 retron St85 family RNA-directed DNA polymerase [Paenibacillus sp. WQ 127069]